MKSTAFAILFVTASLLLTLVPALHLTPNIQKGPLWLLLPLAALFILASTLMVQLGLSFFITIMIRKLKNR